MQGRNRDADVENGYVDTEQEGDGGLIGKWGHIATTVCKTDSKAEGAQPGAL